MLVGLSESKAHAWILIAKPLILSLPCMVRRFVSQAALSSYLTSLYPRFFIPVFNSPAAASPHSKLGLPQMGPPKGNPVFKGSCSTVLDKNQPHCLLYSYLGSFVWLCLGPGSSLSKALGEPCSVLEPQWLA